MIPLPYVGRELKGRHGGQEDIAKRLTRQTIRMLAHQEEQASTTGLTPRQSDLASPKGYAARKPKSGSRRAAVGTRNQAGCAPVRSQVPLK